MRPEVRNGHGPVLAHLLGVTLQNIQKQEFTIYEKQSTYNELFFIV
jgi:hypothetical protein